MVVVGVDVVDVAVVDEEFVGVVGDVDVVNGVVVNEGVVEPNAWKRGGGWWTGGERGTRYTG